MVLILLELSCHLRGPGSGFPGPWARICWRDREAGSCCRQKEEDPLGVLIFSSSSQSPAAARGAAGEGRDDAAPAVQHSHSSSLLAGPTPMAPERARTHGAVVLDLLSQRSWEWSWITASLLLLGVLSLQTGRLRGDLAAPSSPLQGGRCQVGVALCSLV